MKYNHLLFALLLLSVIPQPASAYLDPGFASMVWQMIAAMAFGAAFAAKLYWQKIKNFFSRDTKAQSEE